MSHFQQTVYDIQENLSFFMQNLNVGISLRYGKEYFQRQSPSADSGKSSLAMRYTFFPRPKLSTKPFLSFGKSLLVPLDDLFNIGNILSVGGIYHGRTKYFYLLQRSINSS